MKVDKDYITTFNTLPLGTFTSKDAGLSAATLNAMARRGYITKLEATKPCKWSLTAPQKQKVNNLFKALETIPDIFSFFTVMWRGGENGYKDRKLCSLKNGNTIVDGWGEPIKNLAEVTTIYTCKDLITTVYKLDGEDFKLLVIDKSGA